MVTGLKLMERVVHTAQLLSQTLDFQRLISVTTEQALDNSGADVAGLYMAGEMDCFLAYSRGRDPLPDDFPRDMELVQFIEDCREVIISSSYKEDIFQDLFISREMESAAALPLVSKDSFFGFLLLNSRKKDHFTEERLQFLEGITRMASGLMHNARIHEELRLYLEKIEGLKKYQEDIFSSMSNMLITLDERGNIRYFNKAAKKKLGMAQNNMNQPFQDFFKDRLAKRTLTRLEKARKNSRTLLGVEGICLSKKGEMDYSMNFSSLKDVKGNHSGHVVLLTDQTAEREMAKEVDRVKEDRRMIKDVFARYLSSDIVQQMTNSPDAVHLGGDKKRATIFFADICGYTAFSEGKEPEYILGVLNEFFNEAVEVIINKRGYIDKFIGDCIMAAWGVPMVTEATDAINAVDCALSLQELVASPSRKFFRGEAENLKIAVGMHTGPLVAGNIGGSQRMDYSVIGDTVNIAARLEGVSTAGEVIITQETRDLIGDAFKLEKRKAVSVKGKAKPLQIYNVKGRN